jgi:hypothetical protein
METPDGEEEGKGGATVKSSHSLGTLIEWKQLADDLAQLRAVPTRWGH